MVYMGVVLMYLRTYFEGFVLKEWKRFGRDDRELVLRKRYGVDTGLTDEK